MANKLNEANLKNNSGTKEIQVNNCVGFRKFHFSRPKFCSSINQNALSFLLLTETVMTRKKDPTNTFQ